ncbi:efflux transporter outer membrane subunit [Rhizobacter sp. Root404]|uniref:efflux transporter outer membrane subunit n=1 Tax=Rhizobacter sp. Root404 TaxID=1736528 RepID=UPI001F25E912|nr:efflux transporter outer membrane subunit [Rhizobacter sp. Root404]
MIRPSFNPWRTTLAAATAAALAACSSGPPARPPSAGTDAPPQWQAPVPHRGELTALAEWWRQFDDPMLTALIDAAQAASPTLATATARIAQSRATRVAAGAALLPSVDANASAVRGRQDFISGLGNSASAGVQAAWEIDLFGGRRAASEAAQARFEGAQAGWHDARVAVAAEVGTAYTSLRACEAQVAQSEIDSRSRNETARLTDLSTKAGFESPANAALARASAAQGNGLLTQRRAQCDVLVKGLVALTGIDEPGLRSRLAPNAARLPQPAPIALTAVPAQVLAQRPDLAAAEREVVAASAEVAQARAARLPRITLNGSLSAARIESADFGNSSGTLWSIGPITVALPLFDGGTRRANVDAARARYDEAGLLYRARLRTAVREVEEALVALQSTADRGTDAQTASAGYAASFRATEARFKGGLASLYELEDARRSALQAEIALIDLQRERATAWISLYRALGGGWSAADTSLATLTP